MGRPLRPSLRERERQDRDDQRRTRPAPRAAATSATNARRTCRPPWPSPGGSGVGMWGVGGGGAGRGVLGGGSEGNGVRRGLGGAAVPTIRDNSSGRRKRLCDAPAGGARAVRAAEGWRTLTSSGGGGLAV